MIVDIGKWSKMWDDERAGSVDVKNVYKIVLAETIARYKDGYNNGVNTYNEIDIMQDRAEYKHDVIECVRLHDSSVIGSLIYTYLRAIEYIGYLEGLEDR